MGCWGLIPGSAFLAEVPGLFAASPEELLPPAAQHGSVSVKPYLASLCCCLPVASSLSAQGSTALAKHASFLVMFPSFPL